LPTAAINQHGCRVSLKSERLEVFGRNEATQRDEVLREIPLRDLDRLIVAETVQITSQALAALLRASIPVSVLGCGGQFLGGFLPAQNSHGLARLRQYQHTLDAPFGLQMAGRIVTAKLYNQRRVLQRLAASHSDVGQAPVNLQRWSCRAGGPRRRKAMETRQSVCFHHPQALCRGAKTPKGNGDHASEASARAPLPWCRGAKTPKGNGDDIGGELTFVLKDVVPGGQDAERQWRRVLRHFIRRFSHECRGAKTPKGNGDPSFRCCTRSLNAPCRGAKTPKGNGDMSFSSSAIRASAWCRGAKTPKGNGDSVLPLRAFAQTHRCRGAKTPKGNGDTALVASLACLRASVPGGQDAERQWRLAHVPHAMLDNFQVPGGQDAERQWRHLGRKGDPLRRAAVPGGQDAERQWRLVGLRRAQVVLVECRGGQDAERQWRPCRTALAVASKTRVPGGQDAERQWNAAGPTIRPRDHWTTRPGAV
jgi:hypothetical protein